MTEFETRKAAAIRLLEQTPIGAAGYAPPISRLLWRLGFQAPPLHFVPFAPAALYLGLFFGLSWGGTMSVFAWWAWGDVPITLMLGVSIAAGLMFGLFMAAYYAQGRKKYKLPAWEDLPGTPAA